MSVHKNTEREQENTYAAHTHIPAAAAPSYCIPVLVPVHTPPGAGAGEVWGTALVGTPVVPVLVHS